MRLLNLFFIHLKLFFHRNIQNYLLFLVEIVLSVVFIASFITTIFAEFNYKINYLDPEQYEQYAILSLHGSVSNNLVEQGELEVYHTFLSTVRERSSAAAVSFSSDEKMQMNGLPVTHVIYTPIFEAFQQPTKYGNWLSENSNDCILGGSLEELYDIGDICIIDETPYRVIDYLSPPYYWIDSGIGGTLNIINVLEDPGDVILTMASSEPAVSAYCSLLIKYHPEVTSLETLKKELREIGTLYTVEDLIDNAKFVRNDLIAGNLPIILSMMLICILIATSSLLIAVENNKKNHAILLLLGERKPLLILFLIAAQGILLSVGWSLGTILSSRFCYFLFGVQTILPEAKIFTAIVLSGIFIINSLSVLFVYKSSSLTTYRNNS